MIDFFVNEVTGVRFNGSLIHRYPGNLNVTFKDTNKAFLIHKLQNLAISTGSACSNNSTNDISYVLKAIGVKFDPIETNIRFGIGRFTTEEEVDYMLDLVNKSVKSVR